MQAHVIEKNGENYLSAGEMPVPLMKAVISLLYLATAIFWLRFLLRTEQTLETIHHLMSVVILLQWMSLTFEAVSGIY